MVVGEAGFAIPALHGEDINEAAGAKEEEADGPNGGNDPRGGDGYLRGGLRNSEGVFWKEIEEREDEEEGEDGDGDAGIGGGVPTYEEPHREGGEEGEYEGGEEHFLNGRMNDCGMNDWLG